jgi:hypothetical protein
MTFIGCSLVRSEPWVQTKELGGLAEALLLFLYLVEQLSLNCCHVNVACFLEVMVLGLDNNVR